MRVQRYVLAGVSFVKAINNRVIWEVDERVSIGAALYEISRRAGADMNKVMLVDDCGALVDLKSDIVETVISVVLLSE